MIKLTIYIDLLLILNFIYDFLLLLTVSITLKRNVLIKRILLGALIGGLSTFLIFLPLNKYILLIIKLFAGLLMVLATFDFRDLKYTINNIFYLYMCSVILAGFLYFLKVEFKNSGYLISLLFAPIILYIYIKVQKKLKQQVNYYKKVNITFKNNKKLQL